jgi:hypothetical protein
MWNNASRVFLNLDPESHAILGTSRRVNGLVENGALVVAGGDEQFFRQRIPPPVVTASPFALHLNNPGTITADSKRTAVLICYEQLLVWPMLAASLERPQLLVGLASHRWTANTTIPHSQGLCLSAWARLFRLPLFSAASR